MVEVTLPCGIITFVDAEIAASFDWDTAKVHHTHGQSYVYFVIKRKLKYLHRLIKGSPKGMIVDHRDRNSLNNTGANLRICTHGQNSANSVKKRKFGYKGISLKSKKRPSEKDKFLATVCFQGKYYRSKGFDTQREAALAYDEIALKHQGEYACTNEMLGLL